MKELLKDHDLEENDLQDMVTFLGKRSQDLPTYYRLNGAIYICNTKKFLEEGCMFLKENIYAYEIL